MRLLDALAEFERDDREAEVDVEDSDPGEDSDPPEQDDWGEEDDFMNEIIEPEVAVDGPVVNEGERSEVVLHRWTVWQPS